MMIVHCDDDAELVGFLDEKLAEVIKLMIKSPHINKVEIG